MMRSYLQFKVVSNQLFLLSRQLFQLCLIVWDLLSHDTGSVATKPLPLPSKLPTFLSIIVKKTAEIPQLLVILRQPSVQILGAANLVLQICQLLVEFTGVDTCCSHTLRCLVIVFITDMCSFIILITSCSCSSSIGGEVCVTALIVSATVWWHIVGGRRRRLRRLMIRGRSGVSRVVRQEDWSSEGCWSLSSLMRSWSRWRSYPWHVTRSWGGSLVVNIVRSSADHHLPVLTLSWLIVTSSRRWAVTSGVTLTSDSSSVWCMAGRVTWVASGHSLGVGWTSEVERSVGPGVWCLHDALHWTWHWHPRLWTVDWGRGTKPHLGHTRHVGSLDSNVAGSHLGPGVVAGDHGECLWSLRRMIEWWTRSRNPGVQFIID